MWTRKLTVLGLAVVILALASVASAQPPEFKLYASTEGRYKVQFPGAVKTETVPIKADKGELNLTIDLVELRGGTSFLVTFVDASDEVAKLPAEGRLDKVRDGNKGTDGKVVADKPIAVGVEKYPGRDVLIEKSEGFLRNRAVIAGNRLYQVMVQGPKDVVTSPSADRFFDSFEITK
ncbi:MAG: hypothetical protein C0467_19130 [Planctomycetaceae bacterium]|nr:hypothetical protein [Planctomycetaceae bacterium]